MPVTIEQINEYMSINKKPETIEIDCGAFTVPARTSISIEEKMGIVEYAVRDSFANFITPSVILKNAAFAIAFVNTVCPDFPLPTKEENGETHIDSQAAYEIIQELDILGRYDAQANNLLLGELERYVNDRYEFEKQKLIAFAGASSASSEAIENFNALLYKGIELLDIAANQLEKNGNKLFGKLTEKNIKTWINDLQKMALKAMSKDADTGN